MGSNFMQRHRQHWGTDFARRATLLSLAAFIASATISFYAIGYATERASNSVSDIFLSNIPAVDVDGLFVYGTILLIAFVTLLLIFYPKRAPFTLYTLALFYTIRSGFTMLTHIGPFPIQADTTYNVGVIMSRFLFGSDLFFSAHTGVAFLLALIFWREKNLRIIFLAWSLYFGAVVLLGHLHYSIDVASAFFITYTIYHLALYFFPKTRELFVNDDPAEAEPV